MSVPGTTLILVEGTWGGQWARSRSAFSSFLRENGFNPIRFRGWSTNVSGVPNVLEGSKHSDWIAGGYAFSYFLRDLNLAFEETNVLCHSHGLNPIIYAAARQNIRLRRLVSMSSPVRSDMQRPAIALAHRCEQWRHVHSHGGDMMQLFGELFDRHIGWTRDWRIPGATNVVNLTIPGIGHSNMLKDPKLFCYWKDYGLLDFLRAPQLAPVA